MFATYIMRDGDGQVLYVGRSGKLPGRIEEHRTTMPWFTEVRSIDVQHHATLDEATAAELALIHAHRPPHNTNGLVEKMWPHGGAGGTRELVGEWGF